MANTNIYEGILFKEDKWYIEYLRFSYSPTFSSKFKIIELCPKDVQLIESLLQVDYLGKKVSFNIIQIEDKEYAEIKQ
jgi:hypothetical protein